jgi:hypothetical protein
LGIKFAAMPIGRLKCGGLTLGSSLAIANRELQLTQTLYRLIHVVPARVQHRRDRLHGAANLSGQILLAYFERSDDVRPLEQLQLSPKATAHLFIHAREKALQRCNCRTA